MTDTGLATFDEGMETYRPSAAIDPQRLEYLWSLAARIAGSSLVPESLRTTGPKNNKKDLPQEQVVANVFAVVEQADRWNISPFALLSCAAIVHGKLGFEGKVIAAVLKSRYAIDLNYAWSGDGESMSITVSAKKPGSDKLLEITGTVKGWRTSGEGSPWKPDTFKKMLAYRGAREWCRLHEPAAIMGVLGDDELYAIEMERRAQVARDVTPVLADRFGGGRREGFNPENVKQITNAGQVPMETVREEGEKLSSASSSTGSEQPISNRQVEGSTPSTHATETDAASPPPAGGTGEGGQAGASTARLSADQFRRYASAMARMVTPENVDKASANFWKEAGGAPAKGTPDFDLGFLIYTKQMKRAKCELDVEGLMDEIHGDIDESFSGKDEL